MWRGGVQKKIPSAEGEGFTFSEQWRNDLRDSTRYVAELSWFFTLDNVLTSTRSAALCLCTEQTGSHSLKQQYNIWLLFKIKHYMLTPAHKSQKRNTSSSSNLRSGTFPVVVFTAHTAALQNRIRAVKHWTRIWWNLWVIFSSISLEICQSQILSQI